MNPNEPYIVVKNFEEFQHYKHRNPPWIRLYTRLLDADDLAYSRLQDASKALAIHIWMLASRHDNKIPADIDWLQRRLNLNSNVDLEPLISAGFITIKNMDASTMLAQCKQNAMSEKSRVETEKRRDTPHTPLNGESVRQRVKRVASVLPADGPERDCFMAFRSEYEKSGGWIGTANAETAWVKARKVAQGDTIIAGVGQWLTSEQWTRQDAKICAPAVWLNQRRWEDKPKQREKTAYGKGGDFDNDLFN